MIPHPAFFVTFSSDLEHNRNSYRKQEGVYQIGVVVDSIAKLYEIKDVGRSE
jgi:hypothetical protein